STPRSPRRPSPGAGAAHARESPEPMPVPGSPGRSSSDQRLAGDLQVRVVDLLDEGRVRVDRGLDPLDGRGLGGLVLEVQVALDGPLVGVQGDGAERLAGGGRLLAELTDLLG